MECRICLEDTDPESMLRPCACRGTAEWIHRRCLIRYVAYFPDGICQVCHQPMVHHSPPHFTQYWAILPILFALYMSSVDLSMKLLFFSMIVWIGYLLERIHLWVSLGTTLLLILYGFLSPPVAMNIAAMLLLGGYTASRYIPGPYLAVMSVLVVLELYALFFTYVVHPYLDGWGNGMFNILFMLIWGFWLEHHRIAVLPD